MEPLGDVLREREYMAVVEVQAGGQCLELVDGAPPGPDLAVAEPGHAVHFRGVDAVEVDRVRVCRPVDERDPQPVALATAQRRPRDPAVVGPRGELHARSNLDLLVDGEQLPLPQHAAVRQSRGVPPVEVAQDRMGVEAVRLVVDRAPVAEVRMPPSAWVV